MRRIAVSFVVMSVLFLALPASAQDYPKAEIFGGFSFASVDDPIDIEREAFLGFQTSFAGNFNKSFGIVGDFGGPICAEPQQSGKPARKVTRGNPL